MYIPMYVYNKNWIIIYKIVTLCLTDLCGIAVCNASIFIVEQAGFVQEHSFYKSIY